MEKFSQWLAPIVALFFVTALSVTASSTIGTSITTGGNLDVTGTTTVGTLIIGATPFSPADYAPLASPTFSGTVDLPANVSSGGGTTFDTGGDGSNWTFTASGGGNIVFDSTLGGETILQGRVRLAPVSADPVVCAVGSAGTIAYSGTSNYLCVCDGTSYVQVASTTQACIFTGI